MKHEITDEELREIETRAHRNRDGIGEPEAYYLPGWRLRCRRVGVDCLLLIAVLQAEKKKARNWRALYVDALQEVGESSQESEEQAEKDYASLEDA